VPPLSGALVKGMPKNKNDRKKKNGSGVQQATVVLEPPTQTEALVQVQAGIIQPEVTADEAKRIWDEYVDLCNKILEPGDYVYYVHYADAEGKEQKPIGKGSKELADLFAERLKNQGMKCIEVKWRKRRSAFDKLSKFYNLNMPKPDGPLCTLDVQEVGDFIVEKRVSESWVLTVYQRKDDLSPVKATVTVSVSAPNGRTMMDHGACSYTERKTHPDHDIISTAMTRAINRATSRCIGTGEVSAEEMDISVSGDGAAVVPPAAGTAVEETGAGAKSESPPAQSAPPPKAPATGKKPKEKVKESKTGFKPAEGGRPDRVNHIKRHLGLYGVTPPDYLVEMFILSMDKPISANVRRNGAVNINLLKNAFALLAEEEKENRVAQLEGIVVEATKKDALLNWMRDKVKATYGV